MPPLIQSLLRAEAYPHPTTKRQLLETHISWVVLTGPYAYKIKKPVDFGFVDFTTLGRRERFCHEELRLNRRTAPDMYLDVQPIYGPVEQASFVGAGEPIEFAVRMRQFPQADLLPAVLQQGRLRPEHLDRFAFEVARFQRHAAVADASQPFGEPDAVRKPIDGNFEVLTTLTEHADLVRRLYTWSTSEFARLSAVFTQRKQAGRVREGHGDLHLGNLVLIDDAIQAFDGLEFNDGLRWIDVISEVAFLVMDLQERGRSDLAARWLNHWLTETGDYAGLATWRWYFVYRALVRSKVAALRLKQADLSAEERVRQQSDLDNYLSLAECWTQPRQVAVVITHGVSGSGKSVVAEWVAEQFGAIHLRSDIERKRLFGHWGDAVGPLLTGPMYSAEATTHVYEERLLKLLPTILDAGFPVIVDAAFLQRNWRERFAQFAAGRGVPFVILDVTAEPHVLRERVTARQAAGQDPSDADAGVLDQQLQSREPLTDRELELAITIETDRKDWWPEFAREFETRSGLRRLTRPEPAPL